ncbi:hypothetical protein [Rufibacter immobilis]|uniref:hypothetical protein n=1 Tax=Rufibacter immobilis TaxID=1348778 RepID=UPI0035EE4E21
MKNRFEVHIARELNVDQEGELLIGDRVTYTETIYRFNGITVKTEHHEPVTIVSDFFVDPEFYFYPLWQQEHITTLLYQIEESDIRLWVSFNTEKNEYVEAMGVVEMTVQEYRKLKIPLLLTGI